MSVKVLSIGQCAADSFLLESFFQGLGAECTSVTNEEQARQLLVQSDWKLVLANRVFDSDGSSGLHVLATLSKLPLRFQPVFMLVSNYEDAQSEALACGLTLGFGKADLRSADLITRLKTLLS